ncbi:MAG: type II toxin-antitoxin system VapC family toxin [Pseudomonadota bacterium]
MPRYMLDTNICIYIMKRAPEEVARRMDSCTFGDVVMSSVTCAELEYGVLCANDTAAAKEQLDTFLRAVPVVSFDASAATAYGPIRLASRNRKMDLMDKLIAAHAVSLGLTVVTNNTEDFRHYSGVKLENWVGA